MNPQAPNQPETPLEDNPSDQAVPVQPAPPPVPDYELIRRIGGGAYGEVWLGRSTATGALRAVKIVYRRTFDDERPYEREFEGIQRFERISREHPGQLALFHVGRNVVAGCFYYVMELADAADQDSERTGKREHETRQPCVPVPCSNLPVFPSSLSSYTPRTLSRVLKQRGRLPLKDCVQLGLELTEALANLHGHGLVHRDVKPSNIIFVGGRPKLADIGLVTDTGDSQSIVGTEGYLAPEGPGAPQADLYALGKVLYETATALDRRRFPDLPPDLRNWSDAPGVLELNEVLLKACARDAHQRYPSATAMRDDLALLQRGQSVKHLCALERRVAILTRVGCVTAGLLVAGALAYFTAVTQARRIEREKQNVERLLYAADVNIAQQALEAGNLVRATALLEAHRPRPGREDLRGFEWYYLKNLCRGDEKYSFQTPHQSVESVAISPDGKLLATCGDDHTIQLWDLVSRSPLATLATHAGPVNSIAFSRDGAWLASGGADKTVKIWDVAARTVWAQFTNHAAPVTSVAWSPDGKWLAVGAKGSSAKLWDIKTGGELHEFEMADRSGELVAVSPDGKWLAIGGNGPVLRLWDLPTLQPGPAFYAEAGFVWGIAFSPDNKTIAATRSDGIMLWDIATRLRIDKLRGHDRGVQPVVFSPDAKLLASGSEDTTVWVWDVASRQVIRILKGHKDAVNALAFSPDGHLLISGSSDGTLKLWDLSRQEETGVLRGHSDAVYSIAFTPDDRVLASAGFDGTVKLWDVNSGTNLATLTGHTARVIGVAFSPDGTTLFSCSLDQTIRVWDVSTRAPLEIWDAGKRLSCLAVSPDGRTLAVTTGWWDTESASEVLFWDLPSRQRLTNEAHIHAMPKTISFSADGKILAIGMVDGSLELLDVASNRPIFVSTNMGPEMAWSPRGNSLFTVEEDPDLVAAFDIAGFRIVGHLQIPGGGARSMALSHDGRTLAISYATARIKLCDIASGREVATLQGHGAFGFGLTFSHDGETLASGSNDRTIRLWRAPRK